MIRFFTTPLVLHFWASPQNSMAALASWGGMRSERNTFAIKALDPEFPRDDPPDFPTPRTEPPIPTDVPMPEPHDVPVHEPIDDPPPEPGTVPPETKPQKQPEPNPKPRTVPSP